MLLDLGPEFLKLGKMRGKPRRIANHKVPRNSLKNPEDQAALLNGSHRLVPVFSLSVVLQSDDSLRLVGTIHLLSLGHHLELKLSLLTFVHSRTSHLELHLVNVILGDFTPNLARLGTLKLDQAMMTFPIGRSLNNPIGRRSEKRLLAMTHTRNVLNSTCGVAFLLLLGNRFQNGSPHQRIVQEVPVARLDTIRSHLSHENFVATAWSAINDVTNFRSRNHCGTCGMPRIRTLIFVALILDDPTNIAITDPIARLFHVPSLSQLLLGLVVGRSGATSKECVFLHLLADVRSFPLIGVKKQTELLHDYLWYSARMKTHFLA